MVKDDNIKFFELIENPKRCEVEHLKTLSKIVDRYPYFQFAWSLLYKKTTEENYKPSNDLLFSLLIRTLNQPEVKKDTLTNKSKIILEHLLSNITKPSISSKRQDPKKNNLENESHQNNLINQFLKNPDKKIQSKKNSLGTEQKDLAEQNHLIHSEIATETLAETYTQQNQHNEAIQIYKILQLKFPEKKHIFDVRILEIKKHLDTRKAT